MQALSRSMGLLLAGVFALAGILKLRDLAGLRRTLVAFGWPEAWAATAGTALPIFEVVLACGLVVPVTSEASAAAGLVLISVFIAGIGYNMARGRTPDCHCFGQLRIGSAGRPAFVRAVVLAALALVLVALGPRTHWDMRRAILGGGVLGSSLLFVAVATLTVRKPAASAAPIGTPRAAGDRAPACSLRDLDGTAVGLDTLLTSAKPLVLIFAAPECGSCRALLPVIGRWQRGYSGAVTLAVITHGDAASNRAAALESKTTGVFLQIGNEVGARYGVRSNPTAVLVHPDGTLGSPPVEGAADIATLVTRAAGHLMFDAGPDAMGQSEQWLAAALTSDAIPARQPAIDTQSLDDGGMVLSDPIRQRVRTLNVAAAFIWECCDGNHSVAGVIGEMRDIFPHATEVTDSVPEVLARLLRDQMISVISRTDP